MSSQHYWVTFRDSTGEQNQTQIDSSHPLEKRDMEALLIEQLRENGIHVNWLFILSIEKL